MHGVAGPVERDRLVGLWTDDLVYARAMEAEMVFFGHDGVGFVWQNAGSTRGCVFTWLLDGDRLTTRTLVTFSDRPGTSPNLTLGDGWPFDLDAVRISLAVEDGPYGTQPFVYGS